MRRDLRPVIFDSNPYSPPTRYGGRTSLPFGAPDSEEPLEEDEKPLMEELGIDFHDIFQRTLCVLNPFRPVPEQLLAQGEMAGPMLFLLVYGMILLCRGKLHFSYVYGFGFGGGLAIAILVTLMSAGGISMYNVYSTLGYCLLPMLPLAFFSLFISLTGILGMCLSVLCLLWAVYSATRMFTISLNNSELQWLIAYPVALFYVVFALLTVF
eukprot:GAFH01002567.1.p1 GENE.GAFH01002567.1~~GAFH01002567.1.p1  ORF type:complete len:211 (+),score=36.09 GAFH01002567.1:465-1097(+)